MWTLDGRPVGGPVGSRGPLPGSLHRSCMELNQSNRITAQNSWNLKLIDYLQEVCHPPGGWRQGRMGNTQKKSEVRKGTSELHLVKSLGLGSRFRCLPASAH